jgi:hypothetical protein
MIRTLKINIAFFVCAAFLFRLLFINVDAFASLNFPQKPGALKHFSLGRFEKTEKISNISSRCDSNEFAMQDVYEEETENEDDFSFVKIPVFFSVFFGFLTEANDALVSGISFDHTKYSLSPKKYLVFSTLRI